MTKEKAERILDDQKKCFLRIINSTFCEARSCNGCEYKHTQKQINEALATLKADKEGEE